MQDMVVGKDVSFSSTFSLALGSLFGRVWVGVSGVVAVVVRFDSSSASSASAMASRGSFSGGVGGVGGVGVPQRPIL